MRAVLLRTIAFWIAALCAAVAWGQTAAEESRVLSFKHAETPQQLQEIANLIGAITAITNGSQLSSQTQGTLTMRGTAEQVKLAEWLAKEVDKPGEIQPSQQGALITPEYVAGDDDVVRMLRVNNATTVADFQEIVSMIRATAEIRLTYSLNSQSLIAVRAPRELVRLTEWLVNEIDKPVGPLNTAASPANPVAATANPPAPEYRMSGVVAKSGAPENVVRVFYLTQTPTIPEFQEVVSLMRAITDMRRIFSFNARRALVVRGAAEYTALAEFLYNEVQSAKQPSSDGAAAGQEYRIIPTPPFPSLDLVRVFHIGGIGTPQEFQEFATTIRNKALIRQVFTYNEPRLLVVRGSRSQLTQAEQMVEDRRRQNAQ
jgi:hypothetical protein